MKKKQSTFMMILKKAGEFILFLNFWALVALIALLPVIMSIAQNAWWLLFYGCYLLAIWKWRRDYKVDKRQRPDD